MTKWMLLDIGITMLLISYAADMMSLFLSSISRTTTGAMTLMPFILIFQLVFSGGIIPLPEWSRPLSSFTISNYGIRALAAQSGYNELPMTTVWNTLSGMMDTEIGGTMTVEELMSHLDNPALEKYRDKQVLKSYTVAEAAGILGLEAGDTPEEKLNDPVTAGDIMDFLKTNEALKNNKDQTITLKTTLREVIDIFGEENVRNFVQEKTAAAAHKEEYERTGENIIINWLMLCLYIAVFAILATIVLELIDKDKR